MELRLLNTIRDLYNYGPHKAEVLQEPLNNYYSNHDSFDHLLDVASELCKELIDDNNMYSEFCRQLLQDIQTFKGGDENV